MESPCFARRVRRLLAWIALASLCVGCADTFDDFGDPSFDLWCGGQLCKWQTDEGRVERVGTWNRNDFGVSLQSTPTQISQRHERAPLACLRIETVADVTASARVSVQVDYGDDGVADFEQLVAEARWAKLSFELPPPNEPDLPVRFILRKEGRGRAVLAHLQVSTASSCAELNARADGARCTRDDMCASGRCSDGRCVRCTGAGCGDGIQCKADGECAGGQCLLGRCRSCALTGTCPAFAVCTLDSQCASRLCRSVLAPSQLDIPISIMALGLSSQCAQCRQDADCETGICQRGACAACRSDADCESGARCRYSKEFDATERGCLPPLDAPRALTRSAPARENVDQPVWEMASAHQPVADPVSRRRRILR